MFSQSSYLFNFWSLVTLVLLVLLFCFCFYFQIFSPQSFIDPMSCFNTYMPPTASRWRRTCFLGGWTPAGWSSSRSRCGPRPDPGTPRVRGAGSVPSCRPSPVSQTQEGGRLWLHVRSQNHSLRHSASRLYPDPAVREKWNCYGPDSLVSTDQR